MTNTSAAAFPFAHPIYIRSIVDCLNSLGIRPSTVLTNAGLAWQDLCDGQRMVDFSVFRQLVSHALRCSGESALGLISGSMIQPYHTPVGIGAVTSDCLGDSLEFLRRNAKLIFGALDFGLDNGPQLSTFTVTASRPLFETHEFVMQTIVGAHCRLLEEILGRPAEELVVGLPYSRPSDSNGPWSRFVRNVTFGQRDLTFSLPTSLLSYPCKTADSKAFQEAEERCRRMDMGVRDGAFVQRVRQALLRRLAANPDLGALADELGISGRTLVRRLAEEGLTYSDIKYGLRRTHSVWYLKHTELSIEDIATQLGYADPTSFSRKFKRWHQIAPSRMRQTLHVDSH